MNHLLVYQNLIKKAQNRIKPEGYTESHHILPKALGGNDAKENLIDLTAREHFIAHLLLAKIYGGSMIYAAWLMIDHVNKYNNKLYAWLKESISNQMKGNTRFLGKRHTEKSKQQIREKLFGHTVSSETRQKMKEINRAKAKSGSEHHMYGKHHTEETKQKLREARNKQIMPPVTEEQKRKISEKLKGRQFSEETLLKMSEAKKGKTRAPQSEETKKKISEAKKQYWNHKKGGL